MSCSSGTSTSKRVRILPEQSEKASLGKKKISSSGGFVPDGNLKQDMKGVKLRKRLLKPDLYSFVSSCGSKKKKTDSNVGTKARTKMRRKLELKKKGNFLS